MTTWPQGEARLTKARVQFVGDGAGTSVRCFSSEIRRKLARFDPTSYSIEQIEDYRLFSAGFGDTKATLNAHPSDDFADCLLAAAREVFADKHWRKYEISRGDADAELQTLIRESSALSEHLRTISATVDRMLPIETDCLGIAEGLDAFVARLKGASPTVREIPDALTPRELDRPVADDLVKRVLRVLGDFGVATSATVDGTKEDKSSHAVEILQTLDEVGLVLAKHTWRNSISRVKRQSGTAVKNRQAPAAPPR